MKIRLISDLHIDVNGDFPSIDNNIFTIVAGDIAGSPRVCIKWLKRNKVKGCFIAGNHIVYNNEGKTLSQLKDELRTAFPNIPNADLVFLEKDNIVFDDEKIVIVGTTLYTDYLLNGEAFQEIAMYNAIHGLNDFRWGRIENSKLNPEYYLQEHYKAKEYISDICKKYPDYKIIVVTHHCPSIKCLPTQYQNDSLNASYASSLEEFILDRPNIKLWCCGHIHTKCDFMIGNCRVISNPRGYINYGENPQWDKNGCIIEV